MAQGKQSEVVGTINHMKKKGSLKILIILLLVGALLFIIGGLELFKDDGTDSTDRESDGKKYESFYAYKQSLEDEVKAICESVSGVQNVRAVVFFDGVGESIYAQNVQEGGSNKSEYVIIGSGSSSHALYLGEALPEIAGIGVVCSTGGSIVAKNELCALLAATYGLSMTRIYVAEAK